MLSENIINAARSGDLDLLRTATVKDMAARDEHGLTVAHHACAAHRADVLCLLEKRGKRTRQMLFTRDNHGALPFHAAAHADAPACARTLARLHRAYRQDPPELLVVPHSGYRAVTIAMLSNNAAVLQAILSTEEGVSSLIMEHHEVRKRPILDAAAMGWMDIISLTIDHLDIRDMVDASGETLLHKAAREPRAFDEILRRWPATSQLLSVTDRRGRTPAHVAAMGGYADSLYILGKHFPNTLLPWRGLAAAAAVAAIAGKIDCLAAIYAQGGPAAATLRLCGHARIGDFPMSVCHVAAVHDKPEVFTFIASCPDFVDLIRGCEDAPSPAILAARSGHVRVLEAIARCGGRAMSTLYMHGYNGRTPAGARGRRVIEVYNHGHSRARGSPSPTTTASARSVPPSPRARMVSSLRSSSSPETSSSSA